MICILASRPHNIPILPKCRRAEWETSPPFIKHLSHQSKVFLFFFSLFLLLLLMIAQLTWDPQTKEKPRAPSPIRNSTHFHSRDPQTKEIGTQKQKKFRASSDRRVSFTLRLGPFTYPGPENAIRSPFR